MNDVRTNFVAFLINIIHVKLISKKSIPLNCDHGIFFSIYIFGVNVYFWSIERSLSNIFGKWNVQFVQNISDIFLCLIPNFRLADIFFRIFRIPFGQMVGYIFFQTECLQTILRQCDTIFKFFYHLIRADDQMSLGNRKLAYTCQAMHFTRILVTKQGRSLTIAARKIAVRFLACFIHIILERTSHRTKRKYLFVFVLVPKDEHSFFVMIPMSGNLVQIGFCHKRCLRSHIAAFGLLVLDPALHSLNHFHTVWHNERKPLSNDIYRGK